MSRASSTVRERSRSITCCVKPKVTRDRIMVEQDATYPEYGFAIHKGYCTSAHQAALDRHGPSAIHRWCFDNVARTARVGQP